MDANHTQYGLNDYAMELVHQKARQIVGKAGYTWSDVEDIEQDMILDLLERLPKFDPARAKYTTFVTRVVERKISNLIRDREAPVRDCRRNVCSLNQEVDTGETDPVQLVSIMSEDDHNPRIGKHTRPEEERTDMMLDVAAVLAGLSPELQEVAQKLMSTPVSVVAEELGMPKSTFYDTYIEPLRTAFARKGLRSYL